MTYSVKSSQQALPVIVVKLLSPWTKGNCQIFICREKATYIRAVKNFAILSYLSAKLLLFSTHKKINK